MCRLLGYCAREEVPVAQLMGADGFAEFTGLAALHSDGLWLGTSALRCGGWSIKLVAPDSIRLRQGLRATRQLLARYFPRLGCDPRKL